MIDPNLVTTPDLREDFAVDVKQSIAAMLDSSSMVLNTYISDLSDAELMEKPGEGCNHVAWQLGHLISSECMLLNMLSPGAALELPEGFAEKHSTDNVSDSDPVNFCTKAEYTELFERVHAATKAALENVSEDSFDAPSPERFEKMFPTMGNVWVLLAMHGMMHAGQIVPVRRRLGKPVTI